ncbi:MAG: anaerobic carbon-monoxide dehydrogenase catalytic subunit [Oligoflexia bacterium]|nr:anaerobic carbon-monoxide dehydrogenase catalytic subunit [Oligoflexia bacterium]
MSSSSNNNDDQMLKRARELGIVTAADRYRAQTPKCQFGETGICCTVCLQGPCRITKKPGMDRGVCGANADTIVARNLVRHLVFGAAGHSDHAREMVLALKGVGEGSIKDYKISDPKKLQHLAEKLGLTDAQTQDEKALALFVANKCLQDFWKYEASPCLWSQANLDAKALAKLQEIAILPSAIDREIVHILHQLNMGTDADPFNILLSGLRAGMIDFTGMSMATAVTDILFGVPYPVVTEANLGVLKKTQINIAVHGHNPLLSQVIVYAAKELHKEALEAGASEGINIVGICCTGNELLMREGITSVANYGTQELAVITGVLDAMVVDVQCINPALKEICQAFHTTLITTSPRAKMSGVMHVAFETTSALESALRITREAIASFKRRDDTLIHIPDYKAEVIGGFSVEAMLALFAKIECDHPMRVLANAISNKTIKGICAFIGCNNHRVEQDQNITTMARELAQKDVFILSTGCASGALAKAGLMSSLAVEKYAGPGLKHFLKQLEAKSTLACGLPLVFNMGACVDNSRVALLWKLLAEEMKLPLSCLPVVATSPEIMSEKALAIGCWMVAIGVPVVVSIPLPITGSAYVTELLTTKLKDIVGGYFSIEPDPLAAAKIIDGILQERILKTC